MNELYWITRLVDLGELLTLLSCIIGAVAVFSLVVLFFEYNFTDLKDSTKVKLLTVGKDLWLAFSLMIILNVFIPSRRDMYLIFGVGKIYDTIKESPTAKQIPEDALKAFDNWLKDNSEKSK